MQFADLGWHDHATAAAEDLDVLAAIGTQQVDHVLEVLDMAALIRRHRNALHIFLQRAVHHFLDRPVVTQVDHFAAHALQDASHDVDRGIMAIEQRRCGHESHLVRHAVFGELFGVGQISHRGLCVGGVHPRVCRGGLRFSVKWACVANPVLWAGSAR